MVSFKFILQFPLFCMHEYVVHFYADYMSINIYVIVVNIEYHFIDGLYLAFVMVVSLYACISLIRLVRLASTVQEFFCLCLPKCQHFKHTSLCSICLFKFCSSILFVWAFCLHICLSTVCTFCDHQSEKTVLVLIEWELWVIVNYNVDAGR